jgi:hypothetical protein
MSANWDLLPDRRIRRFMRILPALGFTFAVSQAA